MDPKETTRRQLADPGTATLPPLPPKILAWAEEAAGLFSTATGCTFTVRAMHRRPEEPSIGCPHLTPDFEHCKMITDSLKAGRDDVLLQIGFPVGHTGTGIAAMHRHELAFSLIALDQYGAAKKIKWDPGDSCALCTKGRPGLQAGHIKGFIQRVEKMRQRQTAALGRQVRGNG